MVDRLGGLLRCVTSTCRRRRLRGLFYLRVASLGTIKLGCCLLFSSVSSSTHGTFPRRLKLRAENGNVGVVRLPDPYVKLHCRTTGVLVRNEEGCRTFLLAPETLLPWLFS